MVILVVLTTPIFRFSLPISQLMAKAIPVRGAKLREAKLREADVHWRLLSAFLSIGYPPSVVHPRSLKPLEAISF
ncbi:hypothetical protein AH562_09635 [Salmonella enterica]|nr:hypothetical protein [Salmonella enterica]